MKFESSQFSLSRSSSLECTEIYQLQPLFTYTDRLFPVWENIELVRPPEVDGVAMASWCFWSSTSKIQLDTISILTILDFAAKIPYKSPTNQHNNHVRKKTHRNNRSGQSSPYILPVRSHAKFPSKTLY